jgi:hypothetical protein
VLFSLVRCFPRCFLHGLINYKDTKSKFRLHLCLIEFINWRYSQSCWYFRPSFVKYCPCNLLSGSPPPVPPSPFPKSKYNIYRQSVSGKGWWKGGGCWVVLETIFCRSLTLCFWPDSEPTKLLYHPKHKNLGGEGAWLRQIKHLPQRTFTGQFF